MADPAHEWTDERLAELEARLVEEYREAYQAADAQTKRLAREYEAELKAWQADVRAGRKTPKEFRRWREAQAAHGQWWRELASRLAEAFAEADAGARGAADDEAAEVYAENVNYATFDVETAGQVDTSFSLWDADTVRELARDGHDLLPSTGIDVARDVAWNRRKLSSAVIQSVLLGESVPKLARRLQSVADMDQRAATRAARTAFTAAESAGRAQGYQRAADMGIPVKVMWIATHDSRTRQSHRDVDGEVIEVGGTFSNGLRYPGDPEGPAAEVYNCRCTTGVAEVYGVDLTDLKGSARDWARRDPKAYADWKAGRDGGKKSDHASGRSIKSFIAQDEVRKSLRDHGISEQQAHRRIVSQLKAMGHKDGNAFHGLSRKEQDEVWKRAMSPTGRFRAIEGAHTFGDDLKATNPSYAHGAQWRQNCQRCVPTYEMRRRGFDVVAKPAKVTGKGELSRTDKVANSWRHVFEGQTWEPCASGTGREQCDRLMREWGDGARAEVYVKWKDKRSSHVFVAENRDGRISYMDPQSGKVSAYSHFDLAEEGKTEISRIDNLEPRRVIEDCCTTRGGRP